MDVVETNIADVSVNDEGIPEKVNEYSVKDLLGEGAFAKVYRCEKDTDDGARSFVCTLTLYRRTIYRTIFILCELILMIFIDRH